MSEKVEVLIQLSDVGADAVERVRRETGDYAVPVISGFTPLGSGTLVQIDNWRGILTASHVIHDSRRDLRLDYTGHPERFLRTTIGPFAHDLSISTNALQFVSTKRRDDAYGPDLAFILIPPSPFLSEIAARKSFYNLTLANDSRRLAALGDRGFFAICGFPAVRHVTAPPELGFSDTHCLNGYSMLSGPEKYESKANWDYYEIPVSQESANEFERKFGGVSGGAIWRFVPGRDAKDPPGCEYIDEITLAGVAFYEMDDRTEPRFYIRAHGPESIYRELVQLVRTKLSL